MIGRAALSSALALAGPVIGAAAAAAVTVADVAQELATQVSAPPKKMTGAQRRMLGRSFTPCAATVGGGRRHRRAQAAQLRQARRTFAAQVAHIKRGHLRAGRWAPLRIRGVELGAIKRGRWFDAVAAGLR